LAYMNATQLLSTDSPPVRPRAARRREPGLGSPPCVLRPLSSTVYPRPLSSTFFRRPFVLHLLSSAPAVRRPGPSPQGPRRPSSGAEPSGTLRLPGSSPQGPSAFRARAGRHRPLEVGRGRPVREHRTMTAVFEPAELLTAALSALFLAVPLAVVVAAGVLAVPRRMVSAPGLGIGIGLLAGVVLAAVSIVAGPLG